MLDKSFAEYLVTVGAERSRAKVLDVPNGDPTRAVLALPDGSTMDLQLPWPRRLPRFTNLDSLCLWGRLAGDHEPQAYVSLDQIVVTLSDPRQSAGRLAVGLSEPLRLLQQFAAKPIPLDQRAVIRLLRTTLAGCAPSDLLPVFRSIKRVKNEQGESAYQHQKATIGKALMAELTGSGVVPETVTFSVPVAADPFLSLAARSVECAIDVDAETGTFTFFPLPGALDRALGGASIELYNLVVDAVIRAHDFDAASISDNDRQHLLNNFPVFQGRPE